MNQIEHRPTIEHRAAFDYLGIAVSASLTEWGRVNDCLPELADWLESRSIVPAGAPFYRIVKAGSMEEPFDIVVGFPVDDQIAGDDRVRRDTMPAGRYATYLLTAWFDELWRVHDSVNRWVEVEGVTIEKEGEEFVAVYEQYLTDPRTEPDRDRQQTFVAYKLAD